ncbi:peptidase M23B, partial [Enterococcus faecium UC8733]
IPTEGSAQAAAEPQAAVQEAPVQAEQPVVQETVQTETQAAPVAETQAAPVAETQAAPAVTETAATPASTSSAKEWIAQKESSGSYTATNGRYIGRYQLDSSYLNGDYSAANQEKVAEQYVASRYGSWEAAKAFWEANGWY